jgi:hypothetical protein
MTDLKDCKTIEPLSVFQTQQKKFILQEYPMLDDLMVDTIVRMKGEKIDAIVEQIKSGELKHETPKDPADYIITSVKVE